MAKKQNFSRRAFLTKGLAVLAGVAAGSSLAEAITGSALPSVLENSIAKLDTTKKQNPFSLIDSVIQSSSLENLTKEEISILTNTPHRFTGSIAGMYIQPELSLSERLNFLSIKQKQLDLAKNYEKILAEISLVRNLFLNAYNEYPEPKTLSMARDYLLDVFENSIVPLWYGTLYERAGMSKVPQKDSIACGHFMGRVFSAMGFNIENDIIGQQGATEIMKTMTSRKNITSFREGTSKRIMNYFISFMKNQEKGLYVLGLDTHSAFLLNKEEGLDYINASKLDPVAVVNEDALNATSIRYSSVKVVGKMLDDNSIKGWLRGRFYETVLSPRKKRV